MYQPIYDNDDYDEQNHRATRRKVHHESSNSEITQSPSQKKMASQSSFFMIPQGRVCEYRQRSVCVLEPTVVVGRSQLRLALDRLHTASCSPQPPA